MRKISLSLLLVSLLLSVGCGQQSVETDQIPTLIPTAADTTSEAEETEPEPTNTGMPPTFTPGAPATATTAPPPGAEEVEPLPPTSTLLPTPTPVPPPTRTPEPPPLVVSPVGTVRFDHWLFRVAEAHSDPGSTPSRHTVVLIGTLTNEGTQTDTTTLLDYDLKMRDSQGRVYDPDQVAGFAAEDRYNTEDSTSINPGASRRVAVAFDVPGDATSFSLVPGDGVASWSGEASFAFAETAASAAGASAAPTSAGVGTIRFDHWVFAIDEARSDPGMGSARQAIVLLGTLINEGNQTDTVVFTGYHIKLSDAQGRVYDPDLTTTFAAEDRYGTEDTSSINPGAQRYIAVAFDVPADARTFTLVPGDLTASWGGDVTFTIP